MSTTVTTSYNPFAKGLRQGLERADMDALVASQLPEGLFLEYKQDLQRETVVKIVASFANSYGGCLVLGIAADAQLPTDIVGIELHRPEALKDKVVSWCAQLISPQPQIHVDEVVIREGRAVVVVRVPGGQPAPFITSDGAIYERYVDRSTPVRVERIGSRAALDRISERGDTARAHDAGFFRPEAHVGERMRSTDSQVLEGWIIVYLLAKPSDLVSRPELFSSEEQRRLLASFRAVTTHQHGTQQHSVLTQSFGSVQPTSHGMMLRQDPQMRYPSSSGPGPVRAGHALELLANGSARVFVPVGEWTPQTNDDEWFVRDFGSRWAPLVAIGGWLADVYRAIRRVAMLTEHYLSWMNEGDPGVTVTIGIKLRGLEDAIAIVERHPSFPTSVIDFGLPIVGRDVDIPDSGQPFPVVSPSNKESVIGILTTLIGRALGLQPAVVAEIQANAITEAVFVTRTTPTAN